MTRVACSILVACTAALISTVACAKQPSANYQAGEAAFSASSSVARQVGVAFWPGADKTIHISSITSVSELSIDSAHKSHFSFPSSCGPHAGVIENCVLRINNVRVRCWSVTSAMQCEYKNTSRDTVRLSFIIDGRFVLSGGGRYEVGIWYQDHLGSDAATWQRRLTPIYQHMALIYGETFDEVVDRNIEAAIDKRRKRDQATNDVLAILNGIAAGLSNQPGSSNRNPSRFSASDSTTTTNNRRYAAPDRPFVRRDLRDFIVSDNNLRICVWDDECEDGDRVSVQVQGATSGRGERVFELKNLRTCFNVTIENRATVVLKALNGTGFKGQCNFANENTGVMSVSSGGGLSSWSLNGGTGTSGRITVQR